MVCGICLQEYTAEARPAALLCGTDEGHIFHAPCVRDWLQTRSHDAIAKGCPMCKSAASPDSIIALWPSDVHDFNQYVAVHRSDPKDPGLPVLDAACELVSAVQSYAMAAHGLRAAPMQRVQYAISDCIRRGAINDAAAADAFQTSLSALHKLVAHVENISLILAKAYTHTQQTTVQLQSEKRNLDQQRQQLERERHSMQQDRLALRHKQKKVQKATEVIELRAKHFAEQERARAEEHAATVSKMQESMVASKFASADAVRRAALREQAAEQRENKAEERVRRAEEQAADAMSALETIRNRNHTLADQMRELQDAVRRAQEKSRAYRAECQQQSQTQQSYRKRIAQLEARSEIKSDQENSPPASLVKRQRSSPRSELSDAPSPSAKTKYFSDLNDDDDSDFPMPGGILHPTSKKCHVNPRAPRSHSSQSLSETVPLPWKGTVVLGPRRRPH
ncbi:hypothetical protein MPSI1_002850 [Malassezia psittaci]|uniref:RING-type domain-containing protein n=1 Tax=Malassezia psittaci TaxID=1821823 RepID=A0AAF0FCB4_9BASI|nr:hypothetical protein MPSI1_002850 [Malassezia psittaci]